MDMPKVEEMLSALQEALKGDLSDKERKSLDLKIGILKNLYDLKQQAEELASSVEEPKEGDKEELFKVRFQLLMKEFHEQFDDKEFMILLSKFTSLYVLFNCEFLLNGIAWINEGVNQGIERFKELTDIKDDL
jgi:hypothetical protein